MNHFRISTLLYVVLMFALVACQAQAAPLALAVVPAAVQPASVPATALAQAPGTADAIAGTWSGTVKSADFTFQITTTIGSACAIGSVCGPFDIPAIPCSGLWTLTGSRGQTYQFQAGSFKGACSGGSTADSLQLLPDGTLLYACAGTCGQEQGVLHKIIAQATSPQLVEYKLLTSASEPGGIVAGPDGALWFVETAVNKIGRISTAGVVTEYPVPTAKAIDTDQGFLAVGSDGALWFNEDLVNKIGRITTTGQVTEFALPVEFKPANEQDSPIRAIVTGSDGALWVTSSSENAIVKLTSDGKVAAKYGLPKSGSSPVGMVVGPDGALWFVEKSANQIGRMTFDGKLSEYALPDPSSAALRITVGPDQAMWFTMHAANKIGRINTDGKITTFDAAGMGPVGITTGADGALWFTGYGSTEIGRMTTDGKLTKIKLPLANSVPYQITAGSDGNLWFTEQQGNMIGQIKLSAAASAATPGSKPTTNKLPIGIILPFEDGRWLQDEMQFNTALKAAGDDVQILFSQGDPVKEKADVEALIAQGIKVLIICPQDTNAAAAVVEEAKAAGVKVISYDRLIRGTAAVDFYVTFDSIAVGKAQARYLVDNATGKGNPLYLYAGDASDDNAFLFLEGAWDVLQPKIADGTFVIKNSAAAVSLARKPALSRDELSKMIGQVTTGWDPDIAKSLAKSNLTAAAAADKGSVFVLAPNDDTGRAIADVFAADKDIKSYVVTGQDAEKASVQYIIDGKQSMTIFKDVRTLADDAITAAVAYLNGQAPASTNSYDNGQVNVPAKTSAVITVNKNTLKAALIDSGYYQASDFTGLK